MDPDTAMMIPGFLVLAFLAGVALGHSLGFKSYHPEASNGRTTEK